MSIKDGYIRVTELLEPWSDLSSIPAATLQAKADVGTNVHTAITAYNLGFPIRDLSERESKYFASYNLWEQKTNPKIIRSEERLYDDELMITGQLDCVMEIDTNECIVDFKTSSRPDIKKWSIQLGWYYKLCHHNKIYVDEIAYILHLNDKNKVANLIEIELTDKLLSICDCLYESYIYFNPIK